MANNKTIIEEWKVKDLEDNSSLGVQVFACTEMGNKSLPGIQIFYMGKYTNFEPIAVERWAYEAHKAGTDELLLTKQSWTYHEDRYVKIFLVTGTPLKAKVEMKTRSSKVVIKEFELPFALED